MKRPSIGIMLLAYNQGSYIDEALGSLRQQTCQDFEINLIDDGSNDGFTPEKLRSLDYSKITQKHLYTQNIGVAARQRAQYKNMQNPYIMILCGDDTLAPTFLEKTLAYMRHHSHCGAVSTDVVICFNNQMNLNPPNFVSHVEEKRLTLPNIIAHENFLGSALMRKAAINSIELSSDFKRYQDWDRWVSMLEQGWTLGNINEPLFFYRQLQTSLAHSASVQDELDVRNIFFDKHEKTLRQCLKDYYLALERRDLTHIKETDQRILSLQEAFNRVNDMLKTSEAKRSAAEETVFQLRYQLNELRARHAELVASTQHVPLSTRISRRIRSCFQKTKDQNKK